MGKFTVLTDHEPSEDISVRLNAWAAELDRAVEVLNRTLTQIKELKGRVTVTEPAARQAQNVISEMLAPLYKEAQELKDTVSRDSATRRKENQRMLGLIVVLFMMVGCLLTVVVQNRLRSNENSQILRSTAATNERIADCTTASGACYQEGTKRTESAVKDIARLNILIHLCARDRPSAEAAELETCVIDRMKAGNPKG